MLYQPSYPSPYLSDVDGEHTNEFSCYINADGGTSVTSYRYQISDLNGKKLYTSSVISVQPVYAGEILTFNVPTSVGLVNGLDYTWNITLYEANPDIWITYGTVQSGNNTTTQVYLRPSFLIQEGMYLNINNQLRLINSYNSTNGLATLSSALTNSPAAGTQYNIYANNITSTEYFFRARTTPTLTMATVPSTVTNKSYTFTATYSQAENVGYKYYQWTIYDQRGAVIGQSSEINTGVIEYTFDGFINGNTYGVGLILENQNGVVLTIQPRYFTVVYDQPQIDNPPTATVNCEHDAIDLTWSPLLINTGSASSETTARPQYDYLANEPYLGGSSVRIAKGTALTWYTGSQQAPIYVPYESTTFINWHTTDVNFSGLIYRQEGDYVNLKAMASTPPLTATIGDRYYNTNDKLIYIATGTNTWSIDGEAPRIDIIYNLTTTSVRYVWDVETEDLVETQYTKPYYQLSYANGLFKYEVSNGDFVQTQEVKLYDGDTIPENFIINYWFKFAIRPYDAEQPGDSGIGGGGKPIEITATTWNDLRAYTWDEVAAYTWNQLRYNKI